MQWKFDAPNHSTPRSNSSPKSRSIPVERGDAVFVRINGNLQVHKITAIDNGRYEIGNNHGHINGKVGAQAIFGLAVQIEDRILVSEKELEERLK